MSIQHHRTPKCFCPNCGYELSAATGFAKPKAGDATLCLNCGHFMIFTHRLRLRKPTSAELLKWAGNKELVAASEVVNQFKREKAGNIE